MESDKFSIWVDGKLCGEYNFKGDVTKLDAIYIQGDIDVNCIYMKEQIDDKYFMNRSVIRPISL